MDVVGVGAQGPLSPAFRVRVAGIAPWLAEAGVQVTPLPLFATDAEAQLFVSGRTHERARLLLSARRRLRRTLAENDGRWDVALIQRQVDLLPTRSLERLALAGRGTVLDVDDALWLDATPEAGGHPLARFKRSAAKLSWLAGAAQVVIAGNDLLAEWLARYSPNVHVVPSLVDTGATPLRRHVDSESVVLGWIGSSSTARYLGDAKAVFEGLRDAAPEVRWELVAMGGPVPRVSGVTSMEIPWSEQGERELLSRMDIGLMPLPDTAWARGKCAYKALLYMAAGIPVVCDDVGVSAQVVGDGVGGLVATTRSDWTEAIVTLARDAAVRARLGAAGRERIESEFSVSVWAPRLVELLRSAAQRPAQQQAEGPSGEQHGEGDGPGLRRGRVA